MKRPIRVGATGGLSASAWPDRAWDRIDHRNVRRRTGRQAARGTRAGGGCDELQRRAEIGRAIAGDGDVGGVDQPIAVEVERVVDPCAAEERVRIVARPGHVGRVDHRVARPIASLAGGVAEVKHVGGGKDVGDVFLVAHKNHVACDTQLVDPSFRRFDLRPIAHQYQSRGSFFFYFIKYFI